MSKHTQGPWTLDRDYKTAIQSGKKHVAMVNFYNAPDDETRVSDEEHEANANLICAAPDMLEALKDIQDFLRRSGYDTRLVREVIAKAEGQP